MRAKIMLVLLFFVTSAACFGEWIYIGEGTSGWWGGPRYAAPTGRYITQARFVVTAANPGSPVHLTFSHFDGTSDYEDIGNVEAGKAYSSSVFPDSSGFGSTADANYHEVTAQWYVDVHDLSLDAPVISPSGGFIRPGAGISLSASASGAPAPEIRFTTNGAEPTTSSQLYAFPITSNSDITVKAIAVWRGMVSQISARTFAIGWSSPDIFPASGGFQVGDEVEVTVTNSPGNNGEGMILFRYTYGPGQTAWTQYANPILVTETSTIEAKVSGTDGESGVVSAAYEFILEKAATPVITPTGGIFTELPAVEITCATQGTTIYYTVNGTEPSKTSSAYSGPLSLSGSCRVKAFAAKPNMGDSDKVSRAYILDDPLPQGNGTGDAYTGYLDTRNGLFCQYETLGNDGLLDDIIRLDSDWAGGGSGGSGNTGNGSGTGTGGTTGGDSGGGSGNGGTGSGTGNTGDTSGGTTSYTTYTTNGGDSIYNNTSNTYNSGGGDTDYLGLGAVGAAALLPFIMGESGHTSIYGGDGDDEIKKEVEPWAGRIFFTK